MTSSHAPFSVNSPFANHFSTSHSTQRPQFGGITLPESMIYLDHAAATPVDRRVVESMLPWMTEIYGNPANRLHPMGELAEHGLARSRQRVADCLGVDFEEVIFCSGATEANNLLLRGLAAHPLRKRTKVLVSATEHSSILATADSLSTLGIDVQQLPVDADGQVHLESAKKLIDSNTLAVCVMDVNNETGIIQKHLQDIAHLCKEHGALLHVDAVQGCARGHFHSSTTPFDSATISGAKIYAGKGAAALILRKRHPRTRLHPQISGGGHEFGLRSGTPNLPAIVGFAEGLAIHLEGRKERLHYLAHLESIFSTALEGQVDAQIAGSQSSRVPGILMIRIPNVNAMKLIENAKLLCVSTGSACKTLQATTSHVLKSMGLEEDEALSSFRVSLGITNSEAEMKTAADLIANTARQLREQSAVWPVAKN